MSKWALLKSALIVGKRDTSCPQSIHRFHGFDHLIAKRKIIWRGFVVHYDLSPYLHRYISCSVNGSSCSDSQSDTDSELRWLIDDIISSCNRFMCNVDTNECVLHITMSPSAHHQPFMIGIMEELVKCPFIRQEPSNKHSAVFYVSHPTLDCTKLCEYWQYALPVASVEGDDDPAATILYMLTREVPRDTGLTIRGVLSNRLVGVDNTGNICIWPAEAVLLYVLTTEEYYKRLIVDSKRVLELGGGLTAMAGLGLAIGRDAASSEVVVTDGHPDCVRNQRVCIEMSRQGCQPRSFGRISAQQLHWSPDVNTEQVAVITEGGSRLFDVIIASDCLFFREFHSDLVQTLRSLLSPGGICLFLQPRRSCTMQTFVDKCEDYFHTEIIEDYSAKISQLRQEYQSHPNSSGYDDDIHYPLMLVLRPK